MTTPQGKRISIIVAAARNGVIGHNGKMPWHLPEDLQHFKAITMGHTIVMGRKTFESIGRLLPGRTTIIVSRQPSYVIAGATVVASLEAAIAHAPTNDVFIIGGGELYRAALLVADRVYFTRIALEPPGDTYFPPLDLKQWREVSSQSQVSKSGVSFDFAVFDRAD